MTQATLKFTGANKNPVKRKASPAQLAARARFAEMARSGAFAKKRKTTIKKNPSEAPLHHLYGNKYFKIIKNNDLFEVVIVEKVNTGIGTEYDYYGAKTFKTLAGASRWINKHTPPKTNPINKYIVYSELSPQKYKQMLVTENKQRAIQTADINQMENYHSVVEDETGHLIYDAKTRKKYLTNPRKKTVNQKISQLEHEGYPHKQSIAIALSEQRRGKVKRNPISAYTVFHRGTSNIAGQVMASGAETAKKMVAEKLGIPSVAYLIAKKETNKQGFYAKNPSNEIPAYEITRNFKVLGIFQTKSDAIKAAQGISDATGKTLAVKPVQVLAGHFDK